VDGLRQVGIQPLVAARQRNLPGLAEDADAVGGAAQRLQQRQRVGNNTPLIIFQTERDERERGGGAG